MVLAVARMTDTLPLLQSHLSTLRSHLAPGALAGPYSRCPDRRFIAPPESMDYALNGPPPDSAIDWSQPVRVTCMICHARYCITAADVLQVGAEMTCERCSASVPYPAGAARVQCIGCGLFLAGPDLDDAQRADLDITEGMARLALRDTYLAARRRWAAE